MDQGGLPTNVLDIQSTEDEIKGKVMIVEATSIFKLDDREKKTGMVVSSSTCTDLESFDATLNHTSTLSQKFMTVDGRYTLSYDIYMYDDVKGKQHMGNCTLTIKPYKLHEGVNTQYVWDESDSFFSGYSGHYRVIKRDDWVWQTNTRTIIITYSWVPKRKHIPRPKFIDHTLEFKIRVVSVNDPSGY